LQKQSQNILFIGIGKMGLPMARHLHAQGFSVQVSDPDTSRLSLAQVEGIKVSKEITQDIKQADWIISSLPNDNVLLQVAKLLQLHMNSSACYIDTSTVSLKASEEVLNLIGPTGAAYLRVAVSGNNHMAELATLTMLCSGPKDYFDKAQPLIKNWGPHVFYLGEAEQARLMKLVVNLLIAQTSAMLAEGLTLGRLGGLDWETMWQVLTSSAVGSPIMKAKAQQLGKPLGERDFSPTFTVHQMLKDISLITSAADQLGAKLLQTEMTKNLMEKAVIEGEGMSDYATIIRVLERQVALGE